MTDPVLERVRAARRETEEAYSRAGGKSPDPEMAAVFELIRASDRLTRTLYLARKRLPEGHPELNGLEEFSASLLQEFVHQARSSEKSSAWEWLTEYREIVQRNGELASIITGIFVGTTLLGWVIARELPEYSQAIVSVPLLERIVQNKEWFSSLNENPFIGGLQIAVNNIKVALTCFVAGSLFGVGGVVLMAYNGLMVGVLLGFAVSHGFDNTMINFISGHGPLELSIIVMATYAGTLFGRAWAPPYSGGLGRKLRLAATEAFVVIAGVVPWLVLAALIEAFISPVEAIPISMKMILGAAMGALFWAVTLYPVSNPVKPARNHEASRKSG